jgi:uncharacterized protein (TIGR00730 family)
MIPEPEPRGDGAYSLRALCVFCGSSPGANPRYRAVAEQLGATLAAASVRIVYGGGHVGLMGALADAALTAGGEVVGVIPQHLVDREIAHRALTELRIVQSMHERKALMAELSDGFVALPGGLGTLEEFFEVWTWGQLGLHRKPYALLDVDGFFRPLLTMLDELTAERFVRPEHRAMLLVETDPEHLVGRMRQHRPPALAKWLDRSAT